MSTPINDGGPAFPVDPGTVYGSNGMTLRQWYKGRALSVMSAAPDYSKGPCDGAISDRAARIADFMLAEDVLFSERNVK
jgi:hypothetical protein